MAVQFFIVQFIKPRCIKNTVKIRYKYVKISYYRHIFWKNKCWERLNSRKWTPEKNWNFFDSWKLIPSEYNFTTHENKYLRKIVLLRQLDIFLSLKTLLQENNILSFLSVWTRKRRKNQNTASNYTTNWNQISSNVNEVIRPVLNFFFFIIRFHTHKKHKIEYKAPKA